MLETVATKTDISCIEELTSMDQLAELHGSNVIFDFYAPWCGPCKALSTLLDSMSLELTSYKVKVVRINVDSFQAAASMYNVRSLPTLVFSKNVASTKSAEIVDTHVGSITRSQIQQLLAKHF